jgi:hypothetical protein
MNSCTTLKSFVFWKYEEKIYNPYLEDNMTTLIYMNITFYCGDKTNCLPEKSNVNWLAFFFSRSTKNVYNTFFIIILVGKHCCVCHLPLNRLILDKNVAYLPRVFVPALLPAKNKYQKLSYCFHRFTLIFTIKYTNDIYFYNNVVYHNMKGNKDIKLKGKKA